MHSILINKQSGKAFRLSQGSYLEIVEVEGKQVADLFAVCSENTSETFSAGTTIMKNRKHSLRPTTGDVLYSTQYRPMFTIVADSVGIHDLLIPCCRSESYALAQQEPHPNCLENLNNCFAAFGVGPFPAILPLSVFMNAEITPDQTIRFKPPLSNAGDSLVLRAEMDLIVGITACSDDISRCNDRRCTPMQVRTREAAESW